MSRKILFRGLSLDCKKWLYGDLAHRTYKNENGTEEVWTYIYAASREEEVRREENSLFMTAVDPHTVGQFVGVLDRNGKEEYEGDILERYNERGITMHVNFFGTQFGCVQHWDGIGDEGSWYPLDNYDMGQWEVVGNIYDK